MSLTLFAITAVSDAVAGQFDSWQAVAVALINMIGAVAMSSMREKTNRHREAHQNGTSSRSFARRAVKSSLGGIRTIKEAVQPKPEGRKK